MGEWRVSDLMAFENVFGNIDWGLPARQAVADRAYFAQMLGSAIQQQQFKQKMDLEKRKMEQKGDVDVSKLAENALLKRNMGMTLSHQEEAAIQTMGQTQRPQIYTDPLTQQLVIRPSPWSSLTGGSQFTPAVSPNPPPPAGIGPQGQGANPAISMPYDQIQPRNIEPSAPSSAPLRSDASSYQAPAKLGGRGTIMEEEFKRDVAKKRADLDIEEEAAERAEIKGVPKKEKRILESAFEWQNTSNTIDEAIEMVSPFSAGLGTISSIIPATPARNLAAKLETIQADAAFGALQKMRDNSKTGGALGQVSERELALLKSSQAPLDQAQSPSQLIEALTGYKNVRTQALKRVADAFEEDYGYRPKQIDALLEEESPQFPPSAEGKKIRYKGKVGRVVNGEFAEE